MWRVDYVSYVIWVLPAVIQAVTIALLWYRRQIGLVPWFFALLCNEVLGALATAIAYAVRASETYFYVYWGFRTLGFVFGMGAIYGIFSSVLGSFEALRQLSTRFLQSAVLALVFLALATAVFAPGNENTRLFSALTVMERSVLLVQVGLLLLIFLLSTFFGVLWTNYVFGVALGLAIKSGLELAAFAMRAKFGTVGHFYFELLYGLADGGYGVALFYLAQPVTSRVWGRLPATDLARWNDAISGFLKRQSARSSLGDA